MTDRVHQRRTSPSASGERPRRTGDAMRGAPRQLGYLVLEAAVFLAFFALYYVGRGIAPHRPELATDNALRIIDIEKALGIFVEQSWQAAVVGNDRLVELANFTYRSLHFPMLALAGLCFYLADPRKYRVLRNAVLLSAFIAVPIYIFVPVTPPRLLAEHGYAAFGFVDTIPPSDRLAPGSVANWYAAIPSYHYGWNFLLVVGIFWSWRNPLLRAAAVVFSGVMWWAIVVTGNHYFLDMVLGVVLVMLCLWAALRFEWWADRNPENVARFTVRVGPVRLPF